MGVIDELKYYEPFPQAQKTNKKFTKKELQKNYEEVEKVLINHLNKPMILFVRNVRILKSYFVYLRRDSSGFYGEYKYFDTSTGLIKKTRTPIEVTSLISLQQRLLFLGKQGEVKHGRSKT